MVRPFSLSEFSAIIAPMTHKYCYFQGSIIPFDKAHLALNDLGVLRGHGVFDFYRTYNGKPFHLKDHYARFQQSAKSIGLIVPVSFKDFEKITLDLLKKNKVKDASFRAVILGGPVQNSMFSNIPTFYILTEEVYEPTKDQLEKGVSLIVHEYMRYIPEAKTTNYLEAVRLEKERMKQKAYEILYTADGLVLECSTSNIFMIKGNHLITPDKNILNGITRRVILKLAKKDFKIEERDVEIYELLLADEIFITGTNKQILPVVKVGKDIIGNGKVGDKTKLLQRLWWEEVRK
jgi:D-alanine transaminase/branched-chain amino acid aminotransferase